MNVKSEENPHRFWLRYTVPGLFGSLALGWLAVRLIGGSNPAVWVAILLLGMALTWLVAHTYRTQTSSIAGLLVIVLFGGTAYVGVGAVSEAVLAADGKRTVAQITEVHPRNGKTAGYCLLNTAEGEAIAKRLSPCEGRNVGNALEVTYDPAGRQYPTESVPTPDGGLWWTAGLAAALAAMVLSMPLWGRRGRALEPRGQ